MLVRLALDEEVDAFVDMARQNVEEVRDGHGFDPARMRQVFHDYLDRADPTIYFAERDGEVVGYLLASVGRYRYVDLQFYVQEVIYVRPEHRGTRAAVLLMRHLITEAKRRGFSEVFGGNDYGFSPDRTKRFFEHFGFETVGLCMRLRTG